MIESDTALPLLLFVAQLRHSLPFDSSSAYLKMISFLCDSTQDLLMQFAEFLLGDCSMGDDIEKEMPSLNALLDDIGLSIPIAFQLARPLIRSSLKSDLSKKVEVERSRWSPLSSNIQEVMTFKLKDSVISPSLVTWFWSLSLSDIAVPADRYQSEIKRLKDKYAEFDKKKPTTSRTADTKDTRGRSTLAFIISKGHFLS